MPASVRLVLLDEGICIVFGRINMSPLIPLNERTVCLRSIIYIKHLVNSKTYLTFASRKGEVLEWLKRHAWKACIPLKGITSSNLVLSAENKCVSKKSL